MEKVERHGQQAQKKVHFMKESGKMIGRMVMVFINMKMLMDAVQLVLHMKVIGKMEIWRQKAMKLVN